MPKYSVITPVHLWNQDRVDKFLICAKSLKNQTFKDFEWIVVDDGSIEPFLWESITKSAPEVKIIHLPHNERIIAYNAAFKEAKGQWLCLLDSDDEYKPNFLDRLNSFMEKYPTDKFFNFGAIYSHPDDKFSFRDPFRPKRKTRGHEIFGPGNIVNGTYIFHRSIWEDLGGFPASDNGHLVGVDCSEINYGGERDLFMGSPWDFSAAAQVEFPEIRKYFFIDKVSEPSKVIRELGNPWGQDYYLFYKYTRKYHVRTMKEYLYIVHPR